MRFKEFYSSIFRLLFIYLIGLIIFQFFRFALVINFSSIHELKDYKFDLFKAFFYIGFKYDTVILLYCLVLPLFFIVFSLFIGSFQIRYKSFLSSFLKWFTFIVFMLCVLLLTSDYYYFKFFQSHYNLLAFGIIDDDTKAVLTSVWTDYPVIKILICWTISGFLIYYTIKRIVKKTYNFNAPKSILINIPVIIAIIFLYCIGMRGSLGVFGLEKDDANISPNTFINSITMNGIFSLKDAISDYEHFAINIDQQSTLNSFGYKSKQDALNDYNHGNNPFSDTTKNNPFLEKNPPHVVFFLMESMSNYYFDLNSPTLNLMGELENQKENCVIFRNFLSCQNGTIHSLEGIIVNTPITPLSQSPYMGLSLTSAIAKTYLDKGYETNFITGAKLGWRNLDKYCSHQYFKHIEGSANILEKVPGAQTCEWGAFDEYLFERVYQILAEAKKPQLIFVLTTSNHTPYELPSHYKSYPVNIPDKMKKQLRCDAQIAVKNFTAYQYSNNCLGNLIKKVRSSNLGNKTIISASGDHNTLALFDFDDEHMLQKRSVTFVLYIPTAYKPQNIDITRFGSHKDIFPTLFNITLSHAPYFRSGNNMFDSNPNTAYFALNECNLAIDKYGCALINEGLFFKWENMLLKPTSLNETPNLEHLLKQAKAYSALLTINIQEQLSKKK